MSFASRSLACAFLALGLHACGQAPRAESPADKLSFAQFQALEATNGTPGAPGGDCDEDCMELRQEFRYVAYVGKEIYCYWDLKRASNPSVDFDLLATGIESKIVTGTTTTEHYYNMLQWAAAFHDGHVNVLPPEDMNTIEQFRAPISIAVAAAATEAEAVYVIDAKADTGLAAGDKITAVNGVAIKEAIDTTEALRSGSTQRMRRQFGARLLFDKIGAANATDDLIVTAEHAGQPVTVTLYRTASQYIPFDGVHPQTPTAPVSDLVKAMILPGGIGYLRVDSFSAAGLVDVIADGMNKLAATKGLIIDVRKNGGGDLPTGNEMIARMIKAPVTRYEVAERMSNFLLAERPQYIFAPWTVGDPYAGWHANTVQPRTTGPTYLDKPVAIVTGANCFSACDTFVVGMKSNNLATIVGEGTGGGTGTPYGFELPKSGLSFRYSVVRGRRLDGTWIEGEGTLPDVAISPNADTLLGKKDIQIAKAYEVVKAKLAAASTPAATTDDADKAAAQVLTQAGNVFAPSADQGAEEAAALRATKNSEEM